MMKLLFLIGDAAVGKMTVGQELMKITDLRLFHNHMTIEPVLEVFGQWNWKAIREMREVVFRNIAASDHYGLVYKRKNRNIKESQIKDSGKPLLSAAAKEVFHDYVVFGGVKSNAARLKVN